MVDYSVVLFYNSNNPVAIRRGKRKYKYSILEEKIMIIQKTVNGTTLAMKLEGRLDTTTSPKLEEELRGSVDGITSLVIDFEKLEYISSAGLRVLLSMQKIMNKQGQMLLKNVSETVMEVFEVTGFSEFLNIE